MKWSWKIGEFLGIGVYIHATFPLLLAFIAFPSLVYDHDWLGAAYSIAFVLVLFVCVVMHEYGHALAARRYGIQTRDITLLPIGGVARLEGMPEKPEQELVVAIAGPMVNVVIALALAVVLFVTTGSLPSLASGLEQDSFLASLLAINVVLVLFNLIPAFPMDGGRILRALLSMKLDHAVATRYAAYLGQGIAVLFAIAGFFVNPFLIMTALFIFMGAQAESQMAQTKSKLSGLTVGQAMRTNIRAFAPRDWLTTVLDSMVSTAQQDFPVVENGQVVGLLTHEQLVKSVKQFGAYTPISSVMQLNVPTVEVEQALTQASATMQTQGLTALPVTHQGTLVGMLTLDSIRDFLRLQAALHTVRANEPKTV